MATAMQEKIEVHKEELLSLFHDKSMSMASISRHLEEKRNLLVK